MSQILRIQNRIVHVPSLARVRLVESPFLKRPMVVVQYEDADQVNFTYGRRHWDQATKDYKRLITSMELCREALKSIPMLEADETSKEIVDAEMK
jgi:hypothetical protein